MPAEGIREQLEFIELPMRSENMQNVYHALGAVGKHFDIPDEQWQKSVTDPLRAHDMPVNWKRAKLFRTKALTPMGNLTNLNTRCSREVVIFAPQCVVDSTLPAYQRRQDSWDADKLGPVPSLRGREVPEERPSLAHDFTFGHLSSDKENDTGPWISASFHCGTQLPCIKLAVKVEAKEEPREAHVYIFGTDLTRAEGVLPIEMHTGRTTDIEKYFYDHLASPQVQREQPQLCRPDLYEEILANKVTCIDVKLLGGPEDNTDI